MTRRSLWTTLVVVIAILAAASLLPRYGATLLAWGSTTADRWMAASAGRIRLPASFPDVAWSSVAAIAAMLAAGVGLAVARRAWRRRGGGAEPEMTFALHLERATHAVVPHQGARRREAEALARAGVPSEEIARSTRLSRDAVRAIEAAVAVDRHELPLGGRPVTAG